MVSSARRRGLRGFIGRGRSQGTWRGWRGDQGIIGSAKPATIKSHELWGDSGHASVQGILF